MFTTRIKARNINCNFIAKIIGIIVCVIEIQRKYEHRLFNKSDVFIIFTVNKLRVLLETIINQVRQLQFLNNSFFLLYIVHMFCRILYLNGEKVSTLAMKAVVNNFIVASRSFVLWPNSQWVKVDGKLVIQCFILYINYQELYTTFLKMIQNAPCNRE